MKRAVVFWGIVLIAIGVLLLLGAVGVIRAGAGLIWPLLVIAAGGWLIWAALNRPGRFEVQEASTPLGEATRAHVSIHHGAGRLVIAPGAPTGQLFAGRFGGGLDCRAERAGELLDVRLHIPDLGSRWANPWSWSSGGLDWNMALSNEVPVELEIESGAGTIEADLSGVQLAALRLKTGASSSKLTLPANAGYTQVEVEGGAASVSLRVPPAVSARIVSQGGASGTNVDLKRFPRTGSGYYQSADYDAAHNKVDIRSNLGAGSLEVR
jgi:hypothetical protein